jgi:hypothetical protein
LADNKVESGIQEVRSVTHNVWHRRVFRGEAIYCDHVAPSAAEGVSNDTGGVTHGQPTWAPVAGGFHSGIHCIKEVGQFFGVLGLRVDEWLDGLQ